MRIGNTQIPEDALRALYTKWRIRRLDLFGSARMGRLRDDSDIDLLAEFDAGEQRSLMDLFRAQEEFAFLFGRPVDLVDACSLRCSTNWIRRDATLSSAEVVYAA